MNGPEYAHSSMCPSCKRMVRHRPNGGSHRWHGCRLRWIARKVAQAEQRGWWDGYRFALEHVEEPMVYADLSDYGTGWAALRLGAGIVITERGQG